VVDVFKKILREFIFAAGRLTKILRELNFAFEDQNRKNYFPQKFLPLR